MKVFLGWSGDRSKEIAKAFEDWLPKVIQAVKPFISSGIPKGKRWGEALAEELEKTKVGILCLTRENLDSNWILFEAGALSKTEDAHVCTFLLDVKATDVEEPLASFQHTTFNKEDIQKLLKTINEAVNTSGENALSESQLDSIFNTFWPELEKKLSKIAERGAVESKPIRKDRELLEEILNIVRELKSKQQQLGEPMAEIVGLRDHIKPIDAMRRGSQAVHDKAAYELETKRNAEQLLLALERLDKFVEGKKKSSGNSQESKE